MINWKSILSSFNDKPTLLEWLKLVEKALKESVLKSVTTEQDADKANTKLIFNFEDGTQIDTGFFPTKGKDAAEIRSATSMYIGTTSGLSKSRVTFDKSDGRSFYTDIMAKAGKAVESFSSAVKEVTDENTVNTITVNYDDHTSNTFDISSARGKQGETGATGATGATGVSITGIDSVSNEVVGSQTITNLRVNLSNGESNEFPVYAENGKLEYPFVNRFKTETPFEFKPHTWYAIFGYTSLGHLAQLRYVHKSGYVDGYYGLIFCGNTAGEADALIYTADNKYVHIGSAQKVIKPGSAELSLTVCEVDGLSNVVKG